MRSSNLIRWAGLAAMLGAALGIILTPAFVVASAFSYPGGAEDLPFWAWWVKAAFPLDFASGEQVYFTYGRLYLLTVLPELWALYALRRLRGGGSVALERWGFRLSLVGMWIAVVGIFTDYWTHTPPSIVAELFGSLILLVGFVLLGAGFWKSKALPRWSSLPMISAGLGTPLVVVLIPHAPSGFLLLFHVAWVTVGYVLWSGKVTLVRQPALVR
jgi:hypothetical protein